MLPDAPRFSSACNRRAHRCVPDHADDAFVEFELAQGSRVKLSLVDLSPQGVGFGLNDDQPALALGTTIDPVLIEIGDSRIAGSLRLVHLTSSFGAGTVCGAAFSPRTEADRSAMTGLHGALDKRSVLK